MNSSIFSDWFINIFVPSVKKYLHDKNLPVKAILLLDNAPSHPSTDVLQSSDKSVTAMYLPANTTSLIQPMDQGVLESLLGKNYPFNTIQIMAKIAGGRAFY